MTGHTERDYSRLPVVSVKVRCSVGSRREEVKFPLWERFGSMEGVERRIPTDEAFRFP